MLGLAFSERGQLNARPRFDPRRSLFPRMAVHLPCPPRADWKPMADSSPTPKGLSVSGPACLSLDGCNSLVAPG